MTFGAPYILWTLVLVPALAVLFYLAEKRSAGRLERFVSPRLLPELGATVNRFRRGSRFTLLLIGLALAIIALAKPRWGHTYEEIKRKGLDLIIAVDTSRSMLANDVPPSRLQRVKLAAQDLINEMRGDRVGVIAFAGRAFLQAPLTIDYDAAVTSLNELDTEIIPEGGTNISEAIALAVQTFGKSAVGNRGLIIFTDGEELAGDALKNAKAAAEAGVRIFTVGVGTPEGSLIPLQGQGGGTNFVKDRSGQVVKSKLDEKRLREIAEVTDGIYVPLGQGAPAMRRLYEEGLSQLQAGEIDARMSQKPIERYQWPLGAAILALLASMLISERSRKSRAVPAPSGTARPASAMAAAAALSILAVPYAHAAAPGLEAYQSGKYAEAMSEFQQALQQHPDRATDRLQLNTGAAAYKLGDYAKALQAFSQALLSPEPELQAKSHYNLGNTLYQRGTQQEAADKKLTDWNDAVRHYDEALKIQPENKEAQENRELVLKKIEELKQQQEQQPSPTPSPSPKKDQQKQDQQKQDQKDEQQKNEQQKDQQQDQQQQQNQQQQSDDAQSEKQEQKDSPEQKKEDQQKDGQEQQPGQTPSPSPGSSPSPSPSPEDGAAASPSPSPGEAAAEPSPTPAEGESSPSPSPSPGDQQGESGAGDRDGTPTPTPANTPNRNLSGEVKGAGEQKPGEEKGQELAEAETAPEGEMTEQQALRLLQAMKDEEQRVQLDERRPTRRVYNDW